jgi:phosphatidylglycerophosphate synthase
VLGSFLDPVADKIFVAVVSLSLCCANLLPMPLVGIMYARDLVSKPPAQL